MTQTRKKAQQKKPGVSISDVVGGRKRKNKQSDELEASVVASLAEIGRLKDAYGIFFQRALNKARSAEATRNSAARDTACRELKYAYGVYRYVETIENAFRVVQSELSMQKMTGELAGVIKNLRKVRIPKHAVNFDRLTAQALRGIRLGDINGLSDMTNSLIEKATQATDAASLPDSFIEDLISGRETLDSMPASLPRAEQIDHDVKRLPTHARADQDLRALLDQINSALKR